MFTINTLSPSMNEPPTLFSEDAVYMHDITSLDSSQQKGVCHRIHLDGFYMERVSLHLRQNVQDVFQVNHNGIVLFFLLEGNPQICSSACPLKNIKAGFHNVVYLTNAHGEVSCPCGQYDLFYIHIPEELFKTFSPEDQPVFKKFMQHIQRKEVSILRKEAAHIKPQVYKIIEDIFTYKGNRHFQKIYTKAKIIELISLQFEQLCGQCPTEHPLHKKELQKMYQVRDFIISHLGEYHSLGDLAKMAGTNEYTLKKEFKALFGDTVFGFWQQLKMEKAQDMLLENQKSIKEIAEIIGYKNPQHFSTAFKRQFKMTPSQFRNHNL